MSGRPLGFERAALIVLILAVAPVASSFLQPGFPAGDDTGAHISYIFRFDRALHERQVPVRWVEGPRPGDSQPLFNFYQVGFYYLAEAVHLLTPRLSAAFKLTIVLLWWAGAAFMFLLLAPFGRPGAAAGAIVFALSPYAIGDVLVRGAYPEFAAIVFAVGGMWSTGRLLRTGRRRYVVSTAVLIALLVLCHLPATLIASAAFAAQIAAILIVDPHSRKHLPQYAAATLLGVALAAFYLLPAIVELPFVQIKRLTQNAVDFHRNFLVPGQWIHVAGTQGFNALHISPVQWVAIASASGMTIVATAKRQWNGATVGAAIWLGVVGFAMVMMTAASAPLWEHVSALAYVQFPWRFLLLLSIACAVLTAILVSRAPDARVQFALLMVVAAVTLALYAPRLRAARYLRGPAVNIDAPYWDATPVGQEFGYYERAYDPIGVTERAGPGLERWTVLRGVGAVTSTALTSDEIVLHTSSDGELEIRFNTHTFPEWRLEVDGVPTAFRVTPGLGFMELTVPPGNHEVTAHFGNTAIRRTANAITMMSAAVIAAIGLSPLRKKRWRMHVGSS